MHENMHWYTWHCHVKSLFRSLFYNKIEITKISIPAVIHLSEEHLHSDQLELFQKNPIYGCLSYTFMFLLQFIQNSWARKLSQILSVFMNFLSIYLLLVLIYLRTICVVCVCIYIINALLLYFSFQKYSALDHSSIYDSKRS